MNYKLFTAATLIGVLTGCATTAPEVNLNLLPSEPILEASVLPTQDELNGKPLNVLTMASPNDNKLVARFNLNKELPGKIERIVSGAGASPVDRALATKLIDEIELAEESGNFGTYTGPMVSDLVLVAKLTDANFSKQFNERATYKNDKGETKVRPAYCRFSASVSGYVKVLSLPNMELIETIQFEETESSNDEMRNSYCPISDAQQANMLATAMTDAFDGGSTNLKLRSSVAAKAFIVDKKSDGKNTFFKTTLKRSLGAKEGEEVRLYMQEEGSSELLYVADGVITSNEYITEQFSYIYITDKKLLPMIRKGMVVKLHEECGFLCKASDASNSINSFL